MRSALRAFGVLGILVAGLIVEAAPADALPPVTRIAGADRYATAAAVSSSSFSPGVAVALIATGANYPDALSGGPAGAKLGGPVLLVEQGKIPPATATELARLKPARIAVLGGPEAVSEAVVGSLKQYTPGEVNRVSGADRYATSAKISSLTFAPGVPVAYLATGQNFPDALAGAAAAGAQGGPVLLTSAGGLPPAVGSELDRLNPGSIVILGGTSAVSSTVQNQAAAYGPVARRSGADRYLTAVEVSKAAFGTSARVFLATGLNYPDALAAGPPAGIAKGPVLFVPGNCIPPQVDAEVARTNAGTSTIVGGDQAVSSAVAAGAICQAPPPAPITFGPGTYQVGSQLQPGTYRTRSDRPGCYWERLSGFSGTLDDVIANDATDFHAVVTIKATDAGFKTDSDCGTWTNDLSPITSSRLNPFGAGTWIVGTDIEPGTWTAPGGDGCYWERLSGFGGNLSDIIANDFGDTSPIVAIGTSDAGFTSDEDCGAWHRIGGVATSTTTAPTTTTRPRTTSTTTPLP